MVCRLQRAAVYTFESYMLDGMGGEERVECGHRSGFDAIAASFGGRRWLRR